MARTPSRPAPPQALVAALVFLLAVPGTAAGPVLIGYAGGDVDVFHPDIRASVTLNPGEVPDNDRDDDGNGYVDDVWGASTMSGGGDVWNSERPAGGAVGPVGEDGPTPREASLGTASLRLVARTLRASNASFGFVVCKSQRPDGRGFLDEGVECVDYLLSRGADLVLVQWLYRPRSLTTQAHLDALGRANDALEAVARRCAYAGALLVAAAGDDGADLDGPGFPRSRLPPASLPGLSAEMRAAVLTVAGDRREGFGDSVEGGRELAAASNRGEGSVALSAPSGLEEEWGPEYAALRAGGRGGTAFAAARAAARAAAEAAVLWSNAGRTAQAAQAAQTAQTAQRAQAEGAGKAARVAALVAAMCVACDGADTPGPRQTRCGALA